MWIISIKIYEKRENEDTQYNFQKYICGVSVIHVRVAPLAANATNNGAAATAMFNNLPCVFSMLRSVYRRAETRRTGRDERRRRRGGGGRGGGNRCVRS